MFKQTDLTDNYIIIQIVKHLTRLQGENHGKNEDDAGG